MKRAPTPAQRAREAAGLSLAEAARRAQVSPARLRECELANHFAWGQMLRLSRLYGVGLFVLSPLALAREREGKR